MKTILVPIDFSKSAKHAAKYAAMVAKQLNANITFLHIYAIPIVSEYNLPPGVEQYIHQNQLDAEVQLQEFINQFIPILIIKPEEEQRKERVEGEEGAENMTARLAASAAAPPARS